jgi:YesN/AraC family two-component response regulator
MIQNQRFTMIVAEDESLIRKNIIKKILSLTDRFEVAGEAMDGKTALELVRLNQPDVLVTDIRMPLLSGLDLIKEVRGAFPHVKILIISGYDSFEYAQTAIKYGVSDYILKPIDRGKLEEVLTRLIIRLEKEKKAFRNSHAYLTERSGQESLVNGVAEYMLNHFSEELSLGRLSDSFRVHPTYLTRIFKKHKGKAPLQYLQELRMNEAKRLLKSHPETGIKEIAGSLGYFDQSYFSRVFKKCTGYTPQEYRAGTFGRTKNSGDTRSKA